jgi:Protein phosphatase 2C
VQKAGNEPEEFEDAFFPRRVVDGAAAAGARFAVADGATESSFARLWASILVRLHGRVGLTADTLPGALPRWQGYWLGRVGRRALPWYAEEKVRQGAFTAFAGLTIGGPVGGDRRRIRWEAVAVGDSCLVQVRDDAVLAVFPLTSSAELNDRPVLISSNPVANARLEDHIRRTDGDCRADDAFYLMTDALAGWFLRALEDGERPWHVLRDLSTEDEAAPFGPWIDELRSTRRIRNDDVTLLRVTLL